MNGHETNRKSILFILSAPSGAGKSTVAAKLLSTDQGIRRSISHTTRAPRGGEVDGSDYYFVSDEKFKQMADNGEFIEWARVHGACYGTSIMAARSALEENKNDLLLVIDVQGAQTIRRQGLNCCSIFLMPPSLEELEKRLKGRGTDTDEEIKRRLAFASSEISEKEKFDYIVINDDIVKATKEVEAIINAERRRVANNQSA